MVKKVTFQRAIQFWRTERLIKLYGAYVKKEYRFSDILGGAQSWCDFEESEDWGECVSVFQHPKVAEHQQQQLYKMDVPSFESQYGVQIIPSSVPMQELDGGLTYSMNTSERLGEVLQKKLTQAYPYQKMGHCKKGVLVVGIEEICFQGFNNDLEMRRGLPDLSERFQKPFSDSCFREVVLFDGLANPLSYSADQLYVLFSECN